MIGSLRCFGKSQVLIGTAGETGSRWIGNQLPIFLLVKLLLTSIIDLLTHIPWLTEDPPPLEKL